MKAVTLLSTGIDSPVAAKLLEPKVDEMIFVHGYLSDGSREITKKIRDVINPKSKIYQVPVRHMHESLKKCDITYHCVLCKRMLYRIAEKITENENADFIVTGESIGQVASQTIENIKVLDESVTTPIIRPLITYDKEETIKISRESGLYPLSIEIMGDCPYLPKKPRTKSTIKKIKIEEEKIDVEEIIKTCIEKSIIE